MVELHNLKFSIHQINTITGDLDGNTDKIKKCIEEDHKENCDLSIFPETAISGYMCGSLWDREDFVKEQRGKVDEIHSLVREINYRGTVVVGGVAFQGMKENGFPHLRNAAFIIQRYKKEYQGIKHYSKQLLATSDHHEDLKYFEPGRINNIFSVDTDGGNKVNIGVLICEDLWANDHTRNLALEMKQEGADLIVHINQSYFYYGKQEKRIAQFSKVAREVDIPIISVNSVGVGDILKNIVVFDGGSMIFNNNGDLVFEAPRFREYHYSNILGNLKPSSTPRWPMGKYQEITEALIFEQKEYFKLIGIEKAQVHVSGGLDSAVVAALMVKAMGNGNVILVSNPSDLNTKSISYVNHLEEKLGVKVVWQAIQQVVDKLKDLAPNKKDGWNKGSETALHAVLRSVIGLADCHEFNSGIVATGNHTEIVLGWANFHDIGSIGAHAPLADLTKVEIYGLAKYLNEIFMDEVIPKDLYNGKFKPAAELPDAMEDPIDYWVQSGICAGLIRERMSKEDLIKIHMEIKDDPNHHAYKDLFPESVHVVKYSYNEWVEQVNFAIKAMKRSVFKAAQAPPNVIISPRSRGFSNRETLINKYNK